MSTVLRVILEPYFLMHKGMVINWHRDKTEDKLLYRKEGESSWIERETDYEATFPHRTERIHRVVLRDLEPDTLYEFKFEGEGDEDLQLFKTFPREEKEISVVFMSDHQSTGVQGRPPVNDSVFRAINGHIANEEPDLVIFNGDILMCQGIVNSGRSSAWAEFLDYMSGDLVTKSGVKIPLLWIIGNHDVLPGSLSQTNDVDPTEPPNYVLTLFHTLYDTNEPEYYGGYGHIVCGNWFLLLCLDTHHGKSIFLQKDWLESLYARYKNRYKYVLVAQHLHPYPSSRDFDMVGQDQYKAPIEFLRDEIQPIFQKFGVRYVGVGHEHVWSISKPIYIPEGHGKVLKTDTHLVAENHPKSITFVGGGSVHSQVSRQPTNLGEWWLDEAVSVRNFWKITINDNTFNAQGIDNNGSELRNESMQITVYPYGENKVMFGGGVS